MIGHTPPPSQAFGVRGSGGPVRQVIGFRWGFSYRWDTGRTQLSVPRRAKPEPGIGPAPRWLDGPRRVVLRKSRCKPEVWWDVGVVVHQRKVRESRNCLMFLRIQKTTQHAAPMHTHTTCSLDFSFTGTDLTVRFVLLIYMMVIL